MLFPLYLSPEGIDVYNMISKKIRVVENAPICKKYDIFGFYNSTQKSLTMCMDKIKSYGNIRTNVQETLMHESTHVAQSCKTNFKYLSAFGISKSNMHLTYQKENDLKKVISFNPNLKQIDREAFWMEDKPKQVLYYLKKFCF